MENQEDGNIKSSLCRNAPTHNNDKLLYSFVLLVFLWNCWRRLKKKFIKVKEKDKSYQEILRWMVLKGVINCCKLRGIFF